MRRSHELRSDQLRRKRWPQTCGISFRASSAPSADGSNCRSGVAEHAQGFAKSAYDFEKELRPLGTTSRSKW